MKVIFLDVDGVLNCNARRQFVREIDPAPTALLLQVIQQTDAKLVLSSTWRIGRYDELEAMLTARGFPVGTLIGSTPVLCDEAREGSVLVIARPRSAEILAWLADHPEVTNYVSLDDGDDARVPGHFVRTTWAHGFEAQHAQRAIELPPRPNEDTPAMRKIMAADPSPHDAIQQAENRNALYQALPESLKSVFGQLFAWSDGDWMDNAKIDEHLAAVTEFLSRAAAPQWTRQQRMRRNG